MSQKTKPEEIAQISQIVHANFDQITQWNGDRVPWAEIVRRVTRRGTDVKISSFCAAYHKELARRGSEARFKILSWLTENYDRIKQFQSLGYDLPGILGNLSRGANLKITLPRLTTEFNTMDASRRGDAFSTMLTLPPTTAAPPPPLLTPDSVDHPAEALPASDEPTLPSPEPASGSPRTPVAAHSTARPKTLREPAQSSSPKNPDNIETTARGHALDDTHLQSAPARLAASPEPDMIIVPWSSDRDPEPSDPSPAQNPDPGTYEWRNPLMAKAAEKHKARLAAEAQASAAKQRPARAPYTPKNDPYAKGEDQQKEIDQLSNIVFALVRDRDKASAPEKSHIQKQIDEIIEERDHLQSDFETRYCHDKAKRSALTILSTAALCSGAFRTTVEDDSVDILGRSRPAIELMGFDRPDRLPSVQDDPVLQQDNLVLQIPDPLWVIENYAEDDLAHLVEAYRRDRERSPGFDHGSTTPRRRLMETLLLRGIYVARESGWCEYDRLVTLNGEDCPSPALSDTEPLWSHSAHWNRTPSMRFAPKLTGSEPDRDKLQAHERRKMIDTIGIWLGHAN